MSASTTTKDSLRAMLEQAKERYLAQHADLVNAYKADHPEATTVDILQYIEANTESPADGGGVSLNCLFILFVGLLLIVAVRIQYNVAVEQLFISSLFSSLNPSIEIDLLIKDLPISLDERHCRWPSHFERTLHQNDHEYQPFIDSVEERCEFTSSSINRKLLYLHEHWSRGLSQHSVNLTVLTRWIFKERFQSGLFFSTPIFSILLESQKTSQVEM